MTTLVMFAFTKRIKINRGWCLRLAMKANFNMVIHLTVIMI